MRRTDFANQKNVESGGADPHGSMVCSRLLLIIDMSAPQNPGLTFRRKIGVDRILTYPRYSIAKKSCVTATTIQNRITLAATFF